MGSKIAPARPRKLKAGGQESLKNKSEDEMLVQNLFGVEKFTSKRVVGQGKKTGSRHRWEKGTRAKTFPSKSPTPRVNSH